MPHHQLSWQEQDFRAFFKFIQIKTTTLNICRSFFSTLHSLYNPKAQILSCGNLGTYWESDTPLPLKYQPFLLEKSLNLNQAGRDVQDHSYWLFSLVLLFMQQSGSITLLSFVSCLLSLLFAVCLWFFRSKCGCKSGPCGWVGLHHLHFK